MPRAVMLAALSTEYLAIRTHLMNLQEEVHHQGTIYERGIFATNNQSWSVGIVEIGAGNPRAALEAERAIAHFNPNVIFFVGIAGGLKDVKLGDVVASTKVYGYEFGKAEQVFKPRPEIGLSAYSLEQRARAEAKKVSWLERLDSYVEPRPRVFVAPIAAGEKILVSTEADICQFLRSNYEDAIAVEMEGRGFLEAARANQQVFAIVIRGISTLLDSKEEVSEKNQEIAASHASAFAFELLAKLKLSGEKSIPGLCNLPHRSTNKFIGRKKEISELLLRISDNYRQHLTVLRGIGGVGKTSLVLEVAYMCLEAKGNPNIHQNVPLFDAIVFSSSKATDLVDTKLLDRPEKEPTLLDVFRIIAETLNEPSITQVPTDQQIERVKKLLEKQRTLLIIDNMETLDAEERDKVLAFLNNVPSPTQVIVTTREHLGIDSIPIYSLTKSESIILITEQAKVKKFSIKGSQKKQIYKRFGGIPIALIYAIGQRAAGYDFSEILKPTIPLPEDLGKFCFETSVQPLRNTVSHKLLISIALFRDSPCREALVKVAGLTDGTQETRDGLAKLLQLSLIDEKEGRYTILPITREYVIAEIENITDPEFKYNAQERWIDWYVKFTKQYGELDWEDWRARYDRLEVEWANIESVLYFCAAREKWSKVMELWQNVDNYVDLNGYWQKRRHWWTLLAQKTGDPYVKTVALSEKAWTLILMGVEHNSEAEECLNTAWSLREATNIAVQANTANYLAVLAKIKADYQEAEQWLVRERELLRSSQLEQRERIRYVARNLYHFAELSYLKSDKEIAKEYFKQSISWGEKVNWQRIINYAQNSLAYLLIEESKLEEAEKLLNAGLTVAKNMRETRRIALYHAGFAKLYYRLFKQRESRQPLDTEALANLNKAKDYGQKALTVFGKEAMLSEIREIQELLASMERYYP